MYWCSPTAGGVEVVLDLGMACEGVATRRLSIAVIPREITDTPGDVGLLASVVPPAEEERMWWTCCQATTRALALHPARARSKEGDEHRPLLLAFAQERAASHFM